MSLHCYMKTDKHLIAQEVERDIKEIICRKFKNLLTLKCYIADNEICDWDIRFDDTHGFPVCLKSNAGLEFTHPNDAWSYWAQSVVEDELTLKYSGRMSDEEYPQQEIKPISECHTTFEKYLETTMRHSKEWKKAIIGIELSRLPAELKKL